MALIHFCNISANCLKQLSPDWRPVVKQAAGCLTSAWARLAADVGDANATLILEREWEGKIPDKVIEAGLMQKARFAHMGFNRCSLKRQCN